MEHVTSGELTAHVHSTTQLLTEVCLSQRHDDDDEEQEGGSDEEDDEEK